MKQLRIEGGLELELLTAVFGLQVSTFVHNLTKYFRKF